MSISQVEEMVADLPYSIREDVVGYAQSVQAALPEIFRDARVEFSRLVGDQVVLLAAIRKLYWISSSNFWILENSIHLARESSIGAVVVAGETMNRQSAYYQQLSQLLRDLERLLVELGVREFVDLDSHSDVVRALSSGR